MQQQMFNRARAVVTSPYTLHCHLSLYAHALTKTYQRGTRIYIVQAWLSTPTGILEAARD